MDASLSTFGANENGASDDFLDGVVEPTVPTVDRLSSRRREAQIPVALLLMSNSTLDATALAFRPFPSRQHTPDWLASPGFSSSKTPGKSCDFLRSTGTTRTTD